MTPKEKAKQLIEKITETLNDADMYGWYNPACKNCALIAVDEIINALKIADITSMDGNWYINEWLEVKQEIENYEL